jgi:hypothetical protein
MPSKRVVGPPEKATAADAYRVFLGILMVPLGVVILYRTLSMGIITPTSILLSVVLIAFGLYRTYVAVVRYRMLRASEKNNRAG